MMPYYENALVAIYHADCESLPMFGEILVTDPPYGLPGEDVDGALKRLGGFDWTTGLIITDWRNGHRYAGLRPKCGEVVWEYGWVSGGRSKARHGVRPCHNTIHLFGAEEDFRYPGGSLLSRQPGFSSPRQCSWARKSGHPHEKPIALMEHLMRGIQKPGMVVDPFMGSGTTLLAAQNCGREAIGIETEEKWCEVAAERCSQEVLAL